MDCSECNHPHEGIDCPSCFCGGFNGIPTLIAPSKIALVPGYGNPYAKLMIVGEAPGKNEEIEGRPFVGAAGRFLDKCLSELGISRSEIYITNVVKVRPPENNLKRLSEIGRSIAEFIPGLWDEISTIKPNAILALGNTALEVTTGRKGITNQRGSILLSTQGKYKVIPSIHPAAFLYPKGEGGIDYKFRVVFKHDLKRAYYESVTTDYMPPQHVIHICKSSLDLYNWVKRHRDAGHKRLALDIESLKCIPVCIGLAFTKHSAMVVPLLDVQNWYKKAGIGDKDMNEVWAMLIQLLGDPSIEVIGQNIKYDDQKLQAPCGIKIANVFGDTMFLGHAIHPELPASLQFYTSVYTKEPYYKAEGKEFNIKKDPVDVLYKYCGKDVLVTIESFEEMLKVANEQGVTDFFYTQLMPLHQAYMDIEEIGLLVDLKRREELRVLYRGKLEATAIEFLALTGFQVLDADQQKVVKKAQKKGQMLELKHINLSSIPQLKLFLRNFLSLPERESTDEDTLVALLGNHCKSPLQTQSLNLILNHRGYSKALGAYIESPTDYDGRMRTSFRPTGAETGRSSTKKLAAPVRPGSIDGILKKGGKPKAIGLPFHTLTKHGDIGPEIREMFIPDPGYAFVEADLSQAEPRIVANLSEDFETLQLFGTIDIHKLTATWLFDLTMEALIAREDMKNLRFIGKTVRNGGNYDMHKHRLMLTVNTDARKFHIDAAPGISLAINEIIAGVILEKFHAKMPKIRGIFHKDVKEALESNGGVLINPFGRRRQFLGRWGQDLFREAFAHLPQSIVRDQIIRALLALRKRYPNISIVMENHDALVALVPLEFIEEYAIAMHEEFERPIDFSRCSLPREPLIIPAEIQVGYKNYRDLVKYDVKKAA